VLTAQGVNSVNRVLTRCQPGVTLNLSPQAGDPSSGGEIKSHRRGDSYILPVSYICLYIYIYIYIYIQLTLLTPCAFDTIYIYTYVYMCIYIYIYLYHSSRKDQSTAR